MHEVSKHFNFGDFDQQVWEAIDGNEKSMARLALRGMVVLPELSPDLPYEPASSPHIELPPDDAA